MALSPGTVLLSHSSSVKFFLNQETLRSTVQNEHGFSSILVLLLTDWSLGQLLKLSKLSYCFFHL